jgi:hypothetical protein
MRSEDASDDFAGCHDGILQSLIRLVAYSLVAGRGSLFAGRGRSSLFDGRCSLVVGRCLLSVTVRCSPFLAGSPFDGRLSQNGVVIRRIVLAIFALCIACGVLAAQVDQIRLERHHCYGWCPVDELVLRVDGSAAYSGLANVKRNGDYTARFRPDDLNPLADFIDAHGFERLPAQIGGDGDDAPWQVVSISRGGVTKSVKVQHYERPTALDEVVERLASFGASLPWKAVDSGIDVRVLAGWSQQKPRPPTELQLNYPVAFTREGATAEMSYALQPDSTGRLFLPLQPGTYTVSYFSAKQTLVVLPHTFSRETLVFLIEPPQR